MNVLLEQPWTDRKGVTHEPGESVDVDTVTLAQLEASGVVMAPEGEDTAIPFGYPNRDESSQQESSGDRSLERVEGDAATEPRR